MPHTAVALYVPDESGNPIWLQRPALSEAAEPSDQPDSTPDENGNPSWLAAFNAAVGAAEVQYWPGGTFAEDGLWRSFAGQWVAPAADASYDSDGDGIPTMLDKYPVDATNNSFEWAGGSFTINGIRHAFRAGLYPGSAQDGDSNGVPDVLDDWFTNPSAHGTLQSWPGGTILINGEWNTFGAVSYYADSLTDADADGLPDEIDPYPSDAWNNTYFTWGGVEHRVNGQLECFAVQQYPGLYQDTDGDGIPDLADAFPDDPANNTAWFQGGTFIINGSTISVDAQWHAAGASDANGDGVPDDISLPVVEGTGAPETFVWPAVPTVYVLANQSTQFDPTEYAGTFIDSDADGIPDVADPEPSDPYNSNDSDSDGIPDSIEAQYPALLNMSDGNDAGYTRADGLSYLQAYLNYPSVALDTLIDTSGSAADGEGSSNTGEGESDEGDPNDGDGDGMIDAWELANGLDPSNASDAASSLAGDFVSNLEKYQLGLNPSVAITASEYEGVTGQSWEDFAANHLTSLSAAENDWDADGVSNIDELLVFHTDFRDTTVRPDDATIAEAIIAGSVSATTLMNFQSLTDGNSSDESGNDQQEQSDDEETEDFSDDMDYYNELMGPGTDNPWTVEDEGTKEVVSIWKSYSVNTHTYNLGGVVGLGVLGGLTGGGGAAALGLSTEAGTTLGALAGLTSSLPTGSEESTISEVKISVPANWILKGTFSVPIDESWEEMISPWEVKVTSHSGFSIYYDWGSP